MRGTMCLALSRLRAWRGNRETWKLAIWLAKALVHRQHRQRVSGSSNVGASCRHCTLCQGARMTCALRSLGCQACSALANLKRMTGHSSAMGRPRKGCGRGRSGQVSANDEEEMNERGDCADWETCGFIAACCRLLHLNAHKACIAACCMRLSKHTQGVQFCGKRKNSPAKGAPRCAGRPCPAAGPRPVLPAAAEAVQGTP